MRVGAALTLGLAVALAAALSPGESTTASSSSGALAPRVAAVQTPPAAADRPTLASRAWRLSADRPRLDAAVRPAARQVAALGTPCTQGSRVLCAQVAVPLDRTGQTPGTISLVVQTLPAFGVQRGVIFLVAGGPGQGSAHVFGLADAETAAYYNFLFPGYTLVAFDNRGTGGSGLLNCPGLQGYYLIEQEVSLVGSCASTIGPQRVFYSTREHAEDLEAVRQAVGAERVAVWGTSYGTKLAVAYALAHPDRVERLLLDSVVPTDLDDPFRANSLREMPKALGEFCAGNLCRAATSNFVSDVVTVANRLGAKAVQGKVLQPNGKRKNWRVTGLDVLSVVVDADLNPGLAAVLPAVMRAARLGDIQPLARMSALDAASNESKPEDLSAGLFAATVCNDGPLPWATDAPVAGRPALFQAAVNALPRGALGPFGKWAAQIGNGHFCLGWPPPSGGATLTPGPLPDVPVLAVNGGFDMRTPTASATAVVSRFRQGRLIVVPAVGHSVLGADPSFCAARAVREWMLGNAFSDQCARPKPLVNPIPVYPSAKAKRAASARETLEIVARTLREAEAIALFSSVGDRIAGLYGGRLTGENQGFRLTRYSIAPGVEVSGRIRLKKFGPPLLFEGFVTVGGSRAALGVLGYVGGRLAGTLGGQNVG